MALTDEQVENWRKVLCGMFGAYALIMPRKDIEKFRDRMQGQVDSIPVEKEPAKKVKGEPFNTPRIVK